MFKRSTGVAAAGFLAATMWSMPPAGAVPTGTYAEGERMRIAAQPADTDIAIKVETGPDSAGDPPFVRVTGNVDLDSSDCGPPSGSPPVVTCDGWPARVELVGGQGWARLTAIAVSNQLEVRLVSGAVGGRLESNADNARFTGRDGSEAVVYTAETSGRLAIDLAGGNDLVTIEGPGGVELRNIRLTGPAVVRLGRGGDAFRPYSDAPTPLVVLGGRGLDRLRGGVGDVLKGGPGNDVMIGGRKIVGGDSYDTIRARRDTELVLARDGLADYVKCTVRRTVVIADPFDDISGPCRVVSG
jgi:hypothetical protein